MIRHQPFPRISFVASCCLLAMLLALALLPLVASARGAEDGFNPSANGDITAFAVQADGKIIVGGEFTTVDGQNRNHLARLNADGSLDTGFAATGLESCAGTCVSDIAVQANGRIVIAGSFTAVRPVGAGAAIARTGIVRLDSGGGVDSAFDPQPNAAVLAVLAQPDGSLYIAGEFTQIGQTVTGYVARLNADGTLAAAFAVRPSSYISALALQPDGKLIIGGQFNTIGSDIRSHIARLNVDGTLDPSFTPDMHTDVLAALALQPDGKLLAAGQFSRDGSFYGLAVVRLNVDGSVDPTFGTNLLAEGRALALQPDGKLIVAISHLVSGQFVKELVRLNADGSADATFGTSMDANADALALQADGQLLVGGAFATLDGFSHQHIARVGSDGRLDASLVPHADGDVQTLVVQPDGKLVVGGAFTNIANHQAVRIARLNVDGSIDTGFTASASGPGGRAVYALALQKDGKLVLGGTFTKVDGVSHQSLARVNADGSLDASFTVRTDGWIDALALQPDGALVIGGDFSHVSSSDGDTGVACSSIARIAADGTVDANFFATANGAVDALAWQSNHELLIGGYFTQVNGVPRAHVARLTFNGHLDSAFHPDPNAAVKALVVQPDGQILMGGGFTTIQQRGPGVVVNAEHIVRLNTDGTVDESFYSAANGDVDSIVLQTDGKLDIGGGFSTAHGVTRSYIARLEADGALDATFDPGANNTVYALGVQADGKLVAAGAFSRIDGQWRNYLARLSMPEAPLQSLSLLSDPSGASTITWARSGNGPALAGAPELSVSDDGSTYLSLGPMQRFGDVWRYTGYVPPRAQHVYLRVRGSVSSGYGSASSGLVGTTRQFYLRRPDDIFKNGFD